MFEKWYNIVEDKLVRWVLFIIRMLPNFLLAIIVMALFIILARFVKKLVTRITHRISKSESISGLTSAIIYTIIVIVGIMVSLNILKLDKAVTSLLAGVGIIGLALGFAFQDLTANFISGAFIAFKRPFDVGHVVETNGFIGTIEDIQLRATRMKTFAGLHVMIPNKDIFQKPIINYSLTDARRIEMEFMIMNKGDLDRIQKSLEEMLQSKRSTGLVDGTHVYYSQIEDPKIKLYISVWTTSIEPNAFMKARHEVIKSVVKLLKDHQVIQ
jgi:small conductance mechanosensitive channel